jgi:hypothetical protein
VFDLKSHRNGSNQWHHKAATHTQGDDECLAWKKKRMQFPPGGISPDVNFLSFLSIKRMFIQVVVVLFLL